MPVTKNRNKKGIAILNFETQEIKEEAVGKGYKVDQHIIKILDARTKVCHQCRSTDHLIKDCQIAKENKEREFRQKQNYQRFSQTYKRYQPRVYNTLSNKYNNRKKIYAEIIKRNSNINEQRTQQVPTSNAAVNNNDNNNNQIYQILENINRRLNNIEENINHLNERVDEIQYKQTEEEEMQQEEEETVNITNYGTSQYSQKSTTTNKQQSGNQTKDTNENNEITRYLSQIMEKLGNMENQINDVHQRIDRATGNQNYQQMENVSTTNQF